MAFVVGEITAPVTADPTQFNHTMGQIQRQGDVVARGMTDRFQQVGRQMSTVGRSMMRSITLPLVAIGTAVFKMGKDFEAEMSKIVGLVGIAREQVDEWGKDILEMAPELGKAPRELADALFFVTSAGIRGAEAMNVLEMAAKASAAGLGETKVVADLVTSAMNAYGIENLSAAQATDILVAAVREGKAEAPALAAAMGSVLPIASEMGVGFDEVAGATAAMTRTGTDAATANTQLRQILVSILKPTNQAEEAMEAMGTSSRELREEIREKGLMHVLGSLRELTNTYGDEVMARVFPNVRALAGVLDLMGENMEENIAITQATANATGMLDDAFEAASDTAEFEWQQSLAQIQATLVELFEGLRYTALPMLERFRERLASVTEWFRELDPAAQQLVFRVGLLVAAIGPLLMMTGALVMAMGAIGKAIVAVGAKFALLSGPVGWIALAVTALGGLAHAFWNMSRESQEASLELEERVRRTFEGIKNTTEKQVRDNVRNIVEQYKSLADDSVVYWQEMYLRQIEITDENWDQINKKVAQRKNEYLGIVERQRGEELELIRESLRLGILEDDAHAQELFKQVEDNYTTRQGIVSRGFDEIENIMQGAYAEQRELTTRELNKILTIQETLLNEMLDNLREHTVDWVKIETAAYRDIEELTMQELKKRLQLVEDTFEDEIDALEENVEEQLRVLADLHSRGLLSKDEYREALANVYSEMEKDYRHLADRESEITDDILAQKRRLRIQATREMYQMAKEIEFSFHNLNRSLVGNSIVPDMVDNINNVFGRGLAKTGRTISREIGYWERDFEGLQKESSITIPSPDLGNVLSMNEQSASLFSQNNVQHSGSIRIEGINDSGQLTAAADIVMANIQENIRSGDRGITSRTKLIPIG